MKVEISEDCINEAIAASVQEGISKAAQDYTIVNGVRDATAAAFEETKFLEIVGKAIAEEMRSSIDTVAAAVAKEIAKASAKTAIHVMQDALIATSFQLRKGSFMTSAEEKVEKEKIRAELFGKQVAES